MEFVLPVPDILHKQSGGRGGKRGKGQVVDYQRAWRLLVANCDKISCDDTFESVFSRVKKFGPFYMEEWDTLWQELADDERFDAVFRERVKGRLDHEVRVGDLSLIEEIDWQWPNDVSSRVLHFLRDSDMLRVTGSVRSFENFSMSTPELDNLNLNAKNVCLSREQFEIFQGLTSEIVVVLNSLVKELLTRKEMLVKLMWLDRQMKGLGVWVGDSVEDMLRFLGMESNPNWKNMIELVDGSADGVVLLDLPQSEEEVFGPSWEAVGELLKENGLNADETPAHLMGALQWAVLEEGDSCILTGFHDAQKWKTGDSVHVALNCRRASGFFAGQDGRWAAYKKGYEIVRPMPKTASTGKTVVIKPFEWSAIALMVMGTDEGVQGQLVDFLTTKRRTAGQWLETELGKHCDIDSMVNFVRNWVKEKPLALRIWAVEINAGNEIWTDLFRSLSNVGLETIGRMLEIKIYSSGQMLMQAQRTMLNLLSLAIVEMDDPYLDAKKGIVPALYARLRPVHKRSRKELEDFVAFSSKRLRVYESDDSVLGDIARRAIEIAR